MHVMVDQKVGTVIMIATNMRVLTVGYSFPIMCLNDRTDKILSLLYRLLR